MKRPMFIFVLGLTAALVAVVNAASVNAPVAVTTYHYDNLRTGWNSSETILTAASFPSKFGVLATVLVDGEIIAQPLVVPGPQVANGSLTTDDIVYVVTQGNSVYAIDASTGAILLSVNLGATAVQLGGTPWGIMSTPVIDPASQTLFVIDYYNSTPSGPSPTPTYQLHALSLSTSGWLSPHNRRIAPFNGWLDLYLQRRGHQATASAAPAKWQCVRRIWQ